MSVLVADLLARVRVILNDPAGVHWSNTELTGWLDTAQLEVVRVDPSASVKTATIPLDSNSSAQVLPATAIQFLRGVRNVSGKSIRPVDFALLDASIPNWHETTAPSVTHCLADVHNPRVFYVYPHGAAELVVTYVDTPAPVDSELTIPDIYAPIIEYFVLYKAFDKDADSAVNAELAEKYRGLFYEALKMGTSVRVASQAALNPSRVGVTGY